MGAIEDAVRLTLDAAWQSREEWEAEWGGEPPPISDGQLDAMNLVEAARRERRALPLLTGGPDAEGKVRAVVDRVSAARPSVLEAAVHGEPLAVSHSQLLRELPEVLEVHRQVIRELAEYLDRSGLLRGPVDAELNAAAVPAPEDEDLPRRLGSALRADQRAIVLLARQLDEWLAD